MYESGRCSASAHDDGTVYIVDRGRDEDDFAPYLFKSTDYGSTFTSVVANLPDVAVNVVREDATNPKILYAGTDFGVYVSTDGGARWNVLGGKLPPVPVTDIQIHPRDQMMVIATFGRGVWVTDATEDPSGSAGGSMKTLIRALVVVVVSATSLVLAERPQTSPVRVDPPFSAKPLDPLVESASPDGRFVTYHKDEAKGQIYVRDVSSGSERLLIDLPGEANGVVWAPDSRRLAFTFTATTPPSRDELRVFTLATGEIGSSTEIGTAVAWTSAGEILFRRPTGLNGISGPGAYLRPADGGEARLIWPTTWTGSTGQVGAISSNGSSAIVREYGVSAPSTSRAAELRRSHPGMVPRLCPRCRRIADLSRSRHVVETLTAGFSLRRSTACRCASPSASCRWNRRRPRGMFGGLRRAAWRFRTSHSTRRTSSEFQSIQRRATHPDRGTD